MLLFFACPLSLSADGVHSSISCRETRLHVSAQIGDGDHTPMLRHKAEIAGIETMEFNRMVPHSGQSTGLPSSPRKPPRWPDRQRVAIGVLALTYQSSAGRIGGSRPTAYAASISVEMAQNSEIQNIVSVVESLRTHQQHGHCLRQQSSGHGVYYRTGP